MTVRFVVRPLPAWADPETANRRSASVFRTKWEDTLRKLRYEAERLDASTLILQVVCDEADVRADGMLKVRARVRHPGAVVSLETPAGPLRFATDAYEYRYQGEPADWQANVHAIALGLEALRAVDRTGISRRAEQYVGWRAIGAGPATPMSAGGSMSVEEAAQFITERAAQGVVASWRDLLITSNRRWLREAYRSAAKRLHPDAGGPVEEFQRLEQARRVLEEYRGGG